MARKLRNLLLILLAVAPSFYALDWVLNAYRLELVPKNFTTVKTGVLYRSGQLRADDFRDVIDRYGIKTVFALNPKQAPYEAKIAKQLGVRFIEYEMPGSGQGTPELFHEYLDIMSDPQAQPALVHCAAGAYRTGAAVGLYRMLYDGWTLEDAVAEMKYSGFAGQQDLIDHVQQTFDTIPPSLRRKIAQGEETDEFRR
ncbi:Tyrosine phosphatase family protein [Planctomycetes bacterium Pan216]|uniref:Tyrosine phosphatase family protein n=1 Tax=Kolteria novifilia TaxID=2527975 RepID=A0A518B423_9BACT|nr:Tyrosine phosphatase family protein [Planctomycetes bacterium Pan216]